MSQPSRDFSSDAKEDLVIFDRDRFLVDFSLALEMKYGIPGSES